MPTDTEYRELKLSQEKDHRLLRDMSEKLRALIGPPHLGPGLGIAGDLTPVRGPAIVHIEGTNYEMLTSGNGVIVMSFDAKGDLLVGTANDAYDNLPVGSDGQFMVALASETMGIDWDNFKILNDISPSQITSNQDDYAPTGIATASVLRLTTDASRNITGITTGSDGRVLLIMNVGSFNIVLMDDVTSTAANRFQLTGNLTLPADAGAFLWYDSTSSRWRCIGTYGVSTGASPLTTKGDIYTFTTVDARLPIGTDGQVLKADSSAATGNSWGAIGVVATYPFHDESLTDGATNFIFAGGDIVTVIGVPNP